ncbi:MAG: transcription elongation factor GreA [Lachnospiraceae bacterium]|jgi:transcription elongation factor GreA|nr:transcription elongation factor GreA [Lachnospiraceae bacterium]
MFNQLTKKDIEAMEAEIEERKLVIRPKLLESVKEARAQGDLSENFEYYAAKREKNKNESRIRFLERMIKTAEIIPDDSREDEIGMNTRVKVEFEEDGLEETYKLVTTMRGNSLEGLVSVESPIGKALLGHKAGDRVFVEVNPSYGYYLIIKEIEKNADEADDKLRSF